MSDKVIPFPGMNDDKAVKTKVYRKALNDTGIAIGRMAKEADTEKYMQMLSDQALELQKQADRYQVDIKDLLSDLGYVVIGSDVLTRVGVKFR